MPHHSTLPSPAAGFDAWCEQRWGAREDAPRHPSLTDLRAAYAAGRAQLAQAINRQLERARQPLNDRPKNERVRAQVDQACRPFLEIARDAGLPLITGPSGAWVDETDLS